MFFKKLRSRTKSSKSAVSKPNILTRVLSGPSSTFNGTAASRTHEMTVSPPPLVQPAHSLVATMAQRQSKEEESRDYQEFLEKARKEEEKAERAKLRAIRKAREVNLSPWASKM